MGHHDKPQGQGQAWDKDKTQDQAQPKTQDQGQPWDKDKTQDWEKGTPGMEQGDQTKPPQPDGTTPLERDQRPINQSR